jgi:hypothetical protein
VIGVAPGVVEEAKQNSEFGGMLKVLVTELFNLTPYSLVPKFFRIRTRALFTDPKGTAIVSPGDALVSTSICPTFCAAQEAVTDNETVPELAADPGGVYWRPTVAVAFNAGI